MKKYKVNVNGTSYEIEIEEISSNEVKSSEVKSAPAAATTAAHPVKAEPSAPVASGSGKEITSPMPGTILSVNVTDGQNVKAGDILMILEAMKMENEILAPCDGKISNISVTKSATVDSGSLLCVIA
ncbi:MAG: acetyl-CoA carboxylase biotin carboxyl carrier protein subunit [Clostridiales bacterium]|nr:MAG: acetyl-CoA carboxylase biotin carboxyl carrier protein subunit [Clostridiales bacterium]